MIRCADDQGLFSFFKGLCLLEKTFDISNCFLHIDF